MQHLYLKSDKIQAVTSDHRGTGQEADAFHTTDGCLIMMKVLHWSSAVQLFLLSLMLLAGPAPVPCLAGGVIME